MLTVGINSSWANDAITITPAGAVVNQNANITFPFNLSLNGTLFGGNGLYNLAPSGRSLAINIPSFGLTSNLVAGATITGANGYYHWPTSATHDGTQNGGVTGYTMFIAPFTISGANYEIANDGQDNWYYNSSDGINWSPNTGAGTPPTSTIVTNLNWNAILIPSATITNLATGNFEVENLMSGIVGLSIDPSGDITSPEYNINGTTGIGTFQGLADQYGPLPPSTLIITNILITSSNQIIGKINASQIAGNFSSNQITSINSSQIQGTLPVSILPSFVVTNTLIKGTNYFVGVSGATNSEFLDPFGNFLNFYGTSTSQGFTLGELLGSQIGSSAGGITINTNLNVNNNITVGGSGNILGTLTVTNNNLNQVVVTANTNTYAQVNIQNFNGGTNASQGFVVTADNGSDITNYTEFGLNSHTYLSSVHPGIFGGGGDAYWLNSDTNNTIIQGLSPNSQLLVIQGNTTNVTLAVANASVTINGALNVPPNSGQVNIQSSGQSAAVTIGNNGQNVNSTTIGGFRLNLNCDSGAGGVVLVDQMTSFGNNWMSLYQGGIMGWSIFNSGFGNTPHTWFANPSTGVIEVHTNLSVLGNVSAPTESIATNTSPFNPAIVSTTFTITNGNSRGLWYLTLAENDAATGNPGARIQVPGPGYGTNTIWPLATLLTGTSVATNEYMFIVNPNFTNTIVDISGTGASVTIVRSIIIPF